MICCNPIHQVCDYAALALYCSPPDLEQIRNGVVPLDSLPAAWWNWMWNDTNKAVNEARSAVGVLINEVQSVLSNAGVCLNPSCVDQLYQAIDKIRQRIGNATTAGAVKSSSTPGMISIDDDGLMTANCLGNAANLTTTARTVVGAVNELKQTYDCCFTDVNTCLGTLETGRAPIMHASTSNCYGVGSAACYGHLKISDQYTSVLATCSGVAASQMAVTCVYTAIGTCATALQTNIDGKAPTSHASSATTYGIGSASNYGHLKISDTYSSCVGGVTDGVAASQKALYDAYTYLYDNAGAKLGNTVGCALGTASAGVATVAARSDHVHPLPTCVACSGNADTVDGYHACAAAVASTVAVRTSNGYLDAVLFHDTWAEENINSYSSPKLMFKGNGDGYLRNTDPACVTVGGASCARCAQSLLINYNTWTSSWNWSGQAGQPTWLWGSNDGANMYVWNPSCFCVCHATKAGSANTAGNADFAVSATRACCAVSATYACCANQIACRLVATGCSLWRGNGTLPTCVYKTVDAYIFKWHATGALCIGEAACSGLFGTFLNVDCYVQAIECSDTSCDWPYRGVIPVSGYSTYLETYNSKGYFCAISLDYIRQNVGGTNWLFSGITRNAGYNDNISLIYCSGLIHAYAADGCICIPILPGADLCPNL